MHSTLASEGRQAAMDDSGTVVVAATNARLAIVAGLSLVTESAAAHGRRESSIACSVQSGALAAPDFVSCPPRVDTTAKRPRPALMLAETPQYPRARAGPGSLLVCHCTLARLGRLLGQTQSPVKHSASSLLDDTSATVQTHWSQKSRRDGSCTSSSPCSHCSPASRSRPRLRRA
jgi:hypothetical protein